VPPSEARIQWLCDRELIKELPQTYAYGIDTDDWALVASVFHPACEVEGTLQTAPIAPYLEALEPGVKQYHATLHFMGNQYVEVGDDVGHVETYAVAYHIEAEDSPYPDLLMGVRYQDAVVCARDPDDRWDGWRIKHRHVVKQWHRGPLPRPAATG
jgi:hypothetical protein